MCAELLICWPPEIADAIRLVVNSTKTCGTAADLSRVAANLLVVRDSRRDPAGCGLGEDMQCNRRALMRRAFRRARSVVRYWIQFMQM
jgi:hypothetical protein